MYRTPPLVLVALVTTSGLAQQAGPNGGLVAGRSVVANGTGAEPD